MGKYTYDYKNRLIEVQNLEGKVLVSYSYDPLGRCISKLSGNKLTTYTYAGDQALEEEILNAKTLLHLMT